MSKSKDRLAGRKPAGDEKNSQKKKKTPAEVHRGVRETVESIVIAVILAFLFRAFEAEAFVIPTGSMAPTLQGRHIDVLCDQCNLRYRTGASSENPGSRRENVYYGCCPVCRFQMMFHRADNPHFVGDPDPNHESFNGDRIIVSKFAYVLGDPQRWDVIVFKYPGNPKQNYIKRLVGLPGEAIKIRQGDIYIKKTGGDEFEIARKRPQKIKATLQLVDDTDYIGQMLVDSGWPSRWQERSAGQPPKWQVDLSADGGRYTIEDGTSAVHWLRYRHLVPTPGEWNDISFGSLSVPNPQERFRGQLITDYYAYNFGSDGVWHGDHWVGDLAVECDVAVNSDDGQLLLDLVEAGVHFTCRIDIGSGEAQVSIGSNGVEFTGEGKDKYQRTGQTSLKGAGKYQLRFANVDDELRLWVNESVIRFSGESNSGGIKYRRGTNALLKPKWSPADPGDAAPIGIGSKGVALQVTRLRVLRDVYYMATEKNPSFAPYRHFNNRTISHDYMLTRNDPKLTDPTKWSAPGAFEPPGDGELGPFQLEDDQFFPMGDNSPSSKDARMWDGDEHFVRREFLTGKAVFIYWPHSWRRPIPFWPNFKRMNFIR